MSIEEIIELFKENSFQTIHYKEGWFITGVKESIPENYVIRVRKWVKEVNQSIVGFFYCSIPVIVTDEQILSHLNEGLQNEIKKIKERTESSTG